MVNWDIKIGETLPRKELHDRWGGGRYGGIEPSVKAESVFLFSKPSAGGAFGYKYDGWHSDGTLHYTGDGQIGDQSLHKGGNKSLMDVESLGRTIRVFSSSDRDTTYVGEFKLANPNYYRADSPDSNGEMRSVLVFRLSPLGEVESGLLGESIQDTAEVEELALEANDVEKYALQRPDEPKEAVRREAKLVTRYAAWLETKGQATVRHRVPIPGGGYLFTDLFNKASHELVEAKASAARTYVRAGLGQVLDYARFLDHNSRALLVPVRPSDDLVELLNSYGCAVVWEVGNSFNRQDPSAVNNEG